MIDIKKGDILKADVEALVNTVNCVGVMGRGIALQFRKAFPENFNAYKDACQQQRLQPGTMFVHELGRFINPRCIINFPTKKHWRGKSRIEYIDSGLEALVREVRDRGIKSIAVPPLGCGLGGLRWSEVRQKIEAAFQTLPDVEMWLFEPGGAPPAKSMAKTEKPPKMTMGRAALLVLMNRYLAGLMDPFVTLLEIHKLMYFMQEAGQELRLKYAKARYGPFAENLRHVLNLIEGHFISGYGDAADAPGRQIELDQNAARQAEEFLGRDPQARAHLHRVVDLIEGFETPFGMELLASVHWVATKENARDPQAAVQEIFAWDQRKSQFTEGQISLAWDVLSEKGWLS